MPSLSGAELSLCREITEEIKSESDLSSLLSGLCSTPGPSAHSRRAAFWPKLSCWQTCSWCATDLLRVQPSSLLWYDLLVLAS